MRWIIEPGFWTNPFVHVALVVGGLVAVATSAVGVFVVVRGQSFAGHALSDVATAGGSATFVVGGSPLLGFVLGGVLGAGAIETLGAERARQRDVATGIVLGAALGVAALFLYLSSTRSSATGATQQILFGSIFTVSSALIPAVILLTVVVLVALAVLTRPLLLSSLSPELAAVRGVRVRRIGLCFAGLLAVAVGLASVVLGSILATALLIGPAAAATKLTTRVSRAVMLTAALSVTSTWLGVLLAYNSFDWTSSHRALPVSFFVVMMIVLSYVVCAGLARRHSRTRSR